VLRHRIERLTSQDYVPLPGHPLVGQSIRLDKGDLQFFQPQTEKVVQTVKRGSQDNILYYVVYGDGPYHDELFLVPASDTTPITHPRHDPQLSLDRWRRP